jgi:hypothetical protein
MIKKWLLYISNPKAKLNMTTFGYDSLIKVQIVCKLIKDNGKNILTRQ